MSTFQKIIIVGNLGSDPELRHVGNGNAVANLSVAVNERWKDKGGQSQERTTWFRVTVWGASAENCAKYLTKGRSVLVEGRIQTSSYEKDGVTHYSWEVVANQVTFLSGDGGGGGGNGKGKGARREPPQQDYSDSYTDDDIPF